MYRDKIVDCNSVTAAQQNHLETYMIFMDARQEHWLPLTDQKYINFYVALV
jgi:hypothetical protein